MTYNKPKFMLIAVAVIALVGWVLSIGAKTIGIMIGVAIAAIAFGVGRDYFGGSK